MQYSELGPTGLRVSRLCMGTMQCGWTADEAASFAVLDAFAAAGGNFLDSADIYSYWVRGHRGGESETIVGNWLRSRGNRDGIIVATKVRGRMWPGLAGEGLSRAHIVKACEASLKRLGVDSIDLYQWHWPDEGTPVDESLRAMEDLVAAGKVRAVGVSNYTPALLTEVLEAAAVSGPSIVSLQPHYNLVHREEYEAELERIAVGAGLAVLPYSPLAKGFLTGKYARGVKAGSARANGVKAYATDAGWATLDALEAVADRLEASPGAVALAWLLQRPGVTAPILSANTPAQLADLLPALDLALSNEDVRALEGVAVAQISS